MKNPTSTSRFELLLIAPFLLSGWFLGALCAQTDPVNPIRTDAAVESMMRSRVFQWSDMKARPNNIGAFRPAFDAPTATLEKISCHITTLNPGKEPHPAHRHPEEELLVIKEGTLEVVQNGVTNHVSEGGMVFCASNELHGWRNSGPNPVTYYVLKVYPHDLAKSGDKPAPNTKK